MEHSLGTVLPLYSAIPFAGMLLSIALGPVLFPHFWHHHFGKLSAAWAALVAIPLVYTYRGDGISELLTVIIADYIPFIILLGALFTVGGGILLRTSLKGTTGVNIGFLAIGAFLASWMGTTGAAMLLIRPFLRVNKHRKYRAFMVVFFIFAVANVGGALTPLGDPPLFLGFLHGVPFFWTLRLILPMLTVLIPLLMIYYVFDKYHLKKEAKEGNALPQDSEPASIKISEPIPGKKFEILGGSNFILLAAIIGVVIFSGVVKMNVISVLGVDTGLENIIRNVVLIAIIFLSCRITPKSLRDENEFSWSPILEVTYLFFGIFVTMAPVLAILKSGATGALSFITNAVTEPVHYFFISGALSSFLDNAPTYLTFFNTALGQFYPGMAEAPAVTNLLAQNPAYLLAVSAGSVFFGAVTYIGNAPNFMVRSIAEESGVPMPSFFGYMIYSICILLPLFCLVALLYF